MASYSCILLMVVLTICACEKVACIRPAGGALQYKLEEEDVGSALQYKLEEVGSAATWSGHDEAEGSGSGTWKAEGVTSGHGKAAEGAGSATWYQKATWKEEIGCSPCEEVYVVRDEGETLQTISEKCHAPFILLDNPHVQDTDDISTGSVLLIISNDLAC